MKLPKKEKRNKYTVVLKKSIREIIEEIAKENKMNMSDVIEYCIEYTNQEIKNNEKI